MIASRAVPTGRLRLFLSAIALSLLTGPARAQAPADGWVVWQSTRQEGRFEIYRAHADGSEVTRMTTTGAGKAMWSPDGRWIAYQDPDNAVYLMRPDGSGPHNVSPPGTYFFWLHDNSGLVVVDGDQYSVLDPESATKTPLFKYSDFPQFATTTFQPNAMTHDNRYLLLGSHLYDNGFSGANGSFKSGFSAVMVDLLHKDRTYFIGNGCWPFSAPQGDLVFHICNDCPTHPDIYKLHTADLATRSSYQPEEAHPDPDWGHEYNPRVSSDNQWIAYMGSTGCHDGLSCDYEIFVHRLGAAPTERTRVTTDPGFDGYPDIHIGPLWKPDPAPQLFTRPNRVTFFASASALPAPRTVRVKNGGGGALGALTVSIQPIVPWLSLSGGDGSDFALEVKGAALTAGRNEATVVVTSAGVPGKVEIPVAVVADETFPPAPDAGTPADAAPTEAGGTTPTGMASDGGSSDGTSSDAASASSGGGCSCSVTAGHHGSGALLLLLFVAALRQRRRG
jgi:MYXO-CTERM domain-containing protein